MENEKNIEITPWEVRGSNSPTQSINYEHLIDQFGCQKFTKNLLERIEKITGKKANRFFRRNLVFAHRDFNKLLDLVEQGVKFYLYTGRGPSSRNLHIGHTIPFLLCKSLQEMFSCPLIIQLTDDEKFYAKDLSLESVQEYARENIKDIVCMGFESRLTHVFINSQKAHRFTANTLKISKMISIHDVFKVFGFDHSTSIGLAAFPATEIAPAFSSSFSFLPQQMPCLIPCAVDQDPFFRMARDKAAALGEQKPSLLYVALLPDLRGVNKKMSASDSSSSIFLGDTSSEIAQKIKKYAFSGGQQTKLMHQEMGGNTEIDVSYQYLRFFMESDEELEIIKTKYEKGEMMSSEMKAMAIKEIQKFIGEFQEKRERITKEEIRKFYEDI
ncbi:Tryptophan--tRNA [Nucleospora cyclopteri]